MSTCRICGNDENNISHIAIEMMYGWRDEFEYLECGRCGCVQLRDTPVDLERFYGGNYYSYHLVSQPGWFISRLKKQRAKYVVTGHGILGRLLAAQGSPPDYLGWLKTAGLSMSSRILDVGCGSGEILEELYFSGFGNVIGIDPFVDESVAATRRVTIRRMTLENMNDIFDFVMFNHSLEHMPNQLATLRHVAGILAADGTLMVRVPVASSYAWKAYGVNWVQLDAPRHIYLHTFTSMKILAESAGFNLVSHHCDSTGFQFWGSEQYNRGIPLRAERSYAVNPEKSSFSARELEEFDRRAIALNRTLSGDQAVFFLRKQ